MIDDLKTAGNQFIKCSYSAPAEEGCSSTSTNEVFKGEVSPFAQVAPLLNLPGGLSLDLEQLGSGGDGGWVVDKCWVLPQYFIIRGGSYMTADTNVINGLNVLQNITTDGLGLAPYYGYTNLSQDDVNQCTANNKFSSGDAYKETRGQNGKPGAVVITW